VAECGEADQQSVRRARDILAQQQVGQFSAMVGACQLMEDGAQREETADTGCRGQRRILGAQVRHPSEDMRIAAQLFETSNLRVFRSEIDEEAAHHDVVVALAGRGEGCAQRLDRVREGRRQGVLKRWAAPAHHAILG
jgi:hypothetical protein